MIVKSNLRTRSPNASISVMGAIRRVCADKTKSTTRVVLFHFGDPYGNRTHVTAVKGPCLNRLTNGPNGSGSWT